MSPPYPLMGWVRVVDLATAAAVVNNRAVGAAGV